MYTAKLWSFFCWCRWCCCHRLNGNHNAFSSTLFFIIGRWFSCCRYSIYLSFSPFLSHFLLFFVSLACFNFGSSLFIWINYSSITVIQLNDSFEMKIAFDRTRYDLKLIYSFYHRKMFAPKLPNHLTFVYVYLCFYPEAMKSMLVLVQ